MKSASYKSTKSGTSLKNLKVSSERDEAKKIMDFDECVNMACNKFNMPCKVVVNKEFQDDMYLKSLKSETKGSKRTVLKTIPALATRPSFTLLTDKDEKPIVTTPPKSEDVLKITAIYDPYKLIEVALNDAKTVPRNLVQILGLIMSRFTCLNKFTVKKCKIDQCTIYEMSKFLEFTSITDVCLDGTSFPEANFALLLENTRIHNLSLCRCNLNDIVCETIASKLHLHQPVETCLATLNLSINRITDVGAKYLGLALRSNRYLRYLNLAGNCITDDGANHILQSLMSFPLTEEEIKAERLLFKNNLAEKFVVLKSKPKSDRKSQLLGTIKVMKSRETSITRNKQKNKCIQNSTAIDVTATTALEMCGQSHPYVHPFSRRNVRFVDGVSYCLGNMVLCFLNLAFNNISFLTLKKLIEVLKHQSETKSNSEYGLIKVVIEGNDLPNPKDCKEMEVISNYLINNVMNASTKTKVNGKK